MNVIVTITQGLNLISTFGPVGLEIALLWKRLFADSGAPFEVQIQAHKDGVLQNMAETTKIIADWRAAHPQA